MEEKNKIDEYTDNEKENVSCTVKYTNTETGELEEIDFVERATAQKYIEELLNVGCFDDIQVKTYRPPPESKPSNYSRLNVNVPREKSYNRGKGKNPRPICKSCGKYMYKPVVQVTDRETKKQVQIYPIKICQCGNVVKDKLEWAKIPV